MKRSVLFQALMIGVLCLGGLISVHAQQTTATILGTVTDSSGGVIPGVSVTARMAGTGQTRAAITDHEGNYVLPLLPVGQYELTFASAGFQKKILSGIVLQIGQNARVDATLDVGAVTQEVSVTGAAPLLNSVSTEVGEVIEHKRVVDLPLNGRQFVQLAFLTPAVNPGLVGSVGASMQQTGPKISARGAREYANGFTIDGVTAQDHFFNTLSIAPSVDAVQEFKVETSNYGADKGTKSGAQVNLVIRSGTNAFHGTAFEFLRNDVLDARNFFDPKHIPPFRQNQFGGTVGGPIIKDKAFFFFSYEGLRIRQSITSTFSVPTQALRDGDLSAAATPIINPATGTQFDGNRIPQGLMNSVSKALLQFYPLPTLPGLTQNFVGTPRLTNTSNQYIGRGDVRLSAKDTLFGRIIVGNIDVVNPFGGAQFGAANVTPPLPGFGMITQTIDRNLAVSHTRVFSPRVINEFRFGFNRVVGGQLHENHGNDFSQKAGILGTTNEPDLKGIPSVSVGSFSLFGDQTTVLNNTDNTYEWIDSLTVVRGNHQLKVGGELARLEFNPNLDSLSRGAFVFTPRYTAPPGVAPSPLSAFADFLLGYPSSASVGLGDARVFGRGWNIQGYFQDDWRVTPRLTVNLGIRWDYFGPMGSAKLRGATFDFSRCGPAFGPDNCPNGAFVVPSDGEKMATDAFAPGILARMPFPVIGSEAAHFPQSLFKRDLNNFAPRVGLAYRLGGKTVLRAAYGIFYDLSQFNQVGQESFNPPFFDTRALTNDATPATSTSAPKPRDTIQTILLNQGSGTLRIGPNDPNFPAAYSQQWTFNVQRSVTQNLLVEASYLGSKSTKLQENLSLNDAIPGPGNGRQGAWIPQLSAISYKTVSGASNYHALILRAEERLAHGLALTGSYTWSKSLDYSSATESFLGGGGYQNVRFRRRNYGPSNFDIAHSFVSSFTYDVPLGPGKHRLEKGPGAFLLGGWQAGGILTFHTGQPNTPSLIQNRSNAGGNRPDAIGNGNLPSSQRSPQRYYNSAAFALPAQFVLGNAGRGILRSPGINNVDFSLLKNTSLGERHIIQFRAEFFNVLNHANFDFPVMSWDSPQFGQIFSAKFPRQIQFGLKYIF